jgi:hypothetical protein
MAGRAQTSIDFAVAMGVFLVAVTTVVAFLPDLIQPFSGTPTQNPLLADRVANQVVDYQLAGPSAGVLNGTCTLYFFNTTESSNPCGSFESDEGLQDKLGLDTTANVNVTVERNVTGGPDTEVLCGTGPSGGDVLVKHPCDGAAGEYRLAAGDDLPDSGASVSVARRAVLVGGEQDALLIVRVWS